MCLMMTHTDRIWTAALGNCCDGHVIDVGDGMNEWRNDDDDNLTKLDFDKLFIFFCSSFKN